MLNRVLITVIYVYGIILGTIFLLESFIRFFDIPLQTNSSSTLILGGIGLVLIAVASILNTLTSKKDSEK